MTAIVDTLPIFVSEPSYFPAAKLLYQPKYKRHCYKMQLGITFMGNIVLWTGPHLGCTADITIWRHTWWAHPFTSWEVWLADLGYVGAAGLMHKFKRARGAVLTGAVLYPATPLSPSQCCLPIPKPPLAIARDTPPPLTQPYPNPHAPHLSEAAPLQQHPRVHSQPCGEHGASR